MDLVCGLCGVITWLFGFDEQEWTAEKKIKSEFKLSTACMAGDDASNEFEVHFKEPTQHVHTMMNVYTDYRLLVHNDAQTDEQWWAELIVV